MGRAHIDTMKSMSNLASMLWQKGYYDKAETLDAKYLELRLDVLGKRQAHALKSMNNLATQMRQRKC